MKFMCSLILSCFILTSNLLPQVKITDYNVPISKAMRTMGYMNYNYYGTKDTTITNHGTLEFDYKNYYSSLPFSWSVQLNGSLRYDKNKYFQSPKYKLYTTLDFSSSINKYFNDSSNLFFYGSVNAQQTLYDNPLGSDFSGGLGMGRMIYATAFVKAIRVDEYLYDENLLKEHLSKDELVQLGNLIDRRDEFSTKFNERADVEFYKEIENFLIGTNKLVNGIFDSHALLRTSEVLNREKFNIRFFGWNGKVGLKYKMSESNNYEAVPQRFIPTFNFTFGYPINLKTQINHSTSYDTDFIGYYVISTSTKLIYELTNLIDLNIEYSFYSKQFKDLLFSHTGKLGLNFYLENNINIVIEGTVMKVYSPDIIWVNDYVRQLMTLINFNIGYRIF